MIITDAFKLCVNNGNLIWKILLYLLAVSLVVCGLAVACCYSLVSGLVDLGFFDQIAGMVDRCFLNLNVQDFLSNISGIMMAFGDIISSNPKFIPLLVLMFLILCCGGSFLVSMMHLPMIECLYGYMGSLSRLGFGACFVKNLKQSTLYSLARLLVVFPFDVMMIALLYGCLTMFSLGGVWVIFASFVLMIVFTLWIAIRNTLFGNWATSIVVKGNNIWNGLADSVNSNVKIFGKIFLSSLVITIIVLALNMASIMLTASVGLLITVPCGILMYYVFNNVAYFSTNGLRYYLDKNVIITPHKIENLESMKNLKNII